MKPLNLTAPQAVRLMALMDKSLKRKDLDTGGECVGVDFKGGYEPLGRTRKPDTPKIDCIACLIGYLSWDQSRGGRDQLVRWLDDVLGNWRRWIGLKI